jgi:peptidoglycan/xylan/chitin deacetylase (PgdA/CDA1 family)
VGYFRSVRFYKHLIITVILIIIFAPYVLVAFLFRSNLLLKKQLHSADNSLDYTSVFSLDSIIMPSVVSSPSQYYDLNTIKLIKDSLPYQKKYDDLYVERKAFIPSESNEKIAYLTFDDGPSSLTLKILDTLDEHNIKATFFVTYKDDDLSISIYKEIVNRGHAIGIHTATHVYDEIYNSVDAYLDDFYKIYNHIYEITGVRAEIFRFPGGSVNTYNNTIYKEIISEMLRRGFTYYDWNVDTGDGLKGSTKSSIMEAVKTHSIHYNRIIVLMHDSNSKKETYQALPMIIDYYKENNYRVEKLDSTVIPIIFAYRD